jgi:3-methyladenine DNA glycosylase/8-oxoguanine DNA glycosylase
MSAVAATRTIRPPHPVDLARTLFPIRRGTGDPTMRIVGSEAVRAVRTILGPATLRIRAYDGVIEAEAWGPGTEAALEAAPDLVGATDDDAGFVPHHPIVADLWRRRRGVRLTRTGAVVQALIPAVLEQKVTGVEARRAYRRLVTAVAEPAPGPFEGLVLPPEPTRLAALPSFAFHPVGVERRRAEVLKGICARAGRLDALAAGPLDEAKRRLSALPGVGPWTTAEVARLALGDPDAVSVGDYHLPNLVAWTLAGEPRGTDDRMLQLLEPYRGHRGRVQCLLEASGIVAPRFGPRMPVRSIARL